MDHYNRIYVFLFYSLFFTSVKGSRLRVDLRSNGPAVLDSNITFTATLSYPSGVKPVGPFYCVFSDNNMLSWTTETLDAVEFNVTVSYPSDHFKKGTYRMDVTAYKQEFIFPIPQGSDTTSFELTETLNGKVVALQNSTSQHLEPHNVSTGEETHLVVHFHDPDHFLDQAQEIIFYWIVDDVNQGTTRKPLLKFNFTDVGQHTVMVTIYATFAEPTTTTTMSTTTTVTTTTPTTTTTKTTTTPTTTTPTTTTTPATTTTSATTTTPATTTTGTTTTTVATTTVHPNSTALSRIKRSPHHYQRFIGYKVALLNLELTAQDPVTNVSIHGNNWLKHGDIMNMNISCNGSGPFYYCWAFDGFMNETTNATCELPIKMLTCSFELLHYFSSPGQYILPIVLYNSVSYQVIPLKINIYEADRKAQLSLVVVPIASACVAIITIAFGVGLYFYTRRNLRIEVADFDFEEEEAPEMSFFHRLQSSVLQYWSNLKRSTEPARLHHNSYQNITFD